MFIYEYWHGVFCVCLFPNILTQGAVSIYSILQTAWVITAWTTVSPIRETQKAGMKNSMYNVTFWIYSTSVLLLSESPLVLRPGLVYFSIFAYSSRRWCSRFQWGCSCAETYGHVSVVAVVLQMHEDLLVRSGNKFYTGNPEVISGLKFAAECYG